MEDEQLSIWSPGELVLGISLVDLKQPRHPSRRRNPMLADDFHTAGLVERWGTGITRMFSTTSEAGLPEPEFNGSYRGTFRRSVLSDDRMALLNGGQQQALRYVLQ